MKTKSQSGIWDKVSLGLGWPSAAWVTEQPRAGEEAEGKGNVKDGCCHLSKSGIGERGRTGQGEQGWPACVPGPRSDPGEETQGRGASRRWPAEVGWPGRCGRRGPDTMAAARRRWDADGARPPSLPPRSPCGAWSRPAPTSSASSATAPSLGRRTREPAGPDAGGCERAPQQHRRSGRAGGAGPGARHCGNGVGGMGWGEEGGSR